MNKCIGWDIGIKNLAYCVLESKDVCEKNEKENSFVFNKHTYSISNWADISLVTQIESNLATSGQVSHINNSLTCCGIKNSPKKKPASLSNTDDEQKLCGKKAFYAKEEVLDNGDYQGLCRTHFKKLKIARLPELSVKKCWTEGCNSKPVQVLKSHIFKGFCKKHINEMHKAKTHNDSNFYNINHSKTTSKIDINHLGIALFQELNKIKAIIAEPSIILLENQPVLKNPTMKSMQMFLYSYYLMNMLDSNVDLSVKKLHCYCASKKLDMIKYLPEDEQLRITTFIDTVNNPYQKNKKMSIMMVEVLLKNNVKWLEYFKSNPKQDDLADSLLMTLHYFEKQLSSFLKKQDLENPSRKISRDKKVIKKLKVDKIEDIDSESTAMLEEKKEKKRNRLLVNKKHKTYNDETI